MDGVGGLGKILIAASAALVTVGTALAWQKPWREYPGQDNIAIPPTIRKKQSGPSRA